MSTIITPTPLTTKKSASSPAQKERPAAASAGAPTAASTSDRIRTRAYDIYQARNGNGVAGDAASDWVQAERELNGSALAPTAQSDIEIKAQARGERLLANAK